MARGRPPIPLPVKQMRGTDRQDRINHDAPVVPDGEIKPPAWLREAAIVHWDALAPTLKAMKVMTVADVYALALCADAMAEFVECRANGKISQAQEARKYAKSMMTEFGLSPSSRTRLKATVADDGDELDKWMRG